jgi:ElaB/YqjD/DUF883 family membrane-anchored ribosome-binding protein
VTERTTASGGTAWDADVLPTDADAPAMDAYGTGGAAGDDLTGDPDVDMLVVEIEQTRSEMTGTVEELGQRLDPANIAERAGEKVKEATIGNVQSKVEDMTNTASNFVNDASQTAQQAGSGIVETIRRNPVPAALAGIGIGWLVLNRQSGQTGSSWSSGRSSYGGSNGYRYGDGYGTNGQGTNGSSGGVDLRNRASDVGDTIGQKADQASTAIGDVASNVSQTANEAMSNVSHTANQAVSNVSQTANQAASTVSETATNAMSQAQHAIESNPIAFGAIALAVGTAVGLALPATQTEKRVMGQAGGQLIDKVETAVSQPLEKMESAATR